MSVVLAVHPVDPQERLLRQVVEVIDGGGVIVYPTDSSYALGCHLGDKAALERIRRIRRTERDHDFTLVCSDLSEIATYARVDNWAYRMLRAHTPGPYTFILKATQDVPKRLRDPKRKAIGIRVPDNRIALMLISLNRQPVMSSTLLLPGDDFPLTDVEEIKERVGSQVDLIVDGGAGGIEPTTVVDLSHGRIELLREGKGDATAFR
ncbi:MAG: L-threonylcarbamoyladenylate synthase [Gammaproteobacteria bacterium]|jgi:tRNA threonylcarbamoyl adenosine modification protein (Sua5/YciO/YrdC/YwlC family)